MRIKIIKKNTDVHNFSVFCLSSLCSEILEIYPSVWLTGVFALSKWFFHWNVEFFGNKNWIYIYHLKGHFQRFSTAGTYSDLNGKTKLNHTWTYALLRCITWFWKTCLLSFVMMKNCSIAVQSKRNSTYVEKN